MRAALSSLSNTATEPYIPAGPFMAEITMRQGRKAARKLARRWGFSQKDTRIIIEAADMKLLYRDLLRLCYLTPLTVKMLPLGLTFYNLTGRLGLEWVRRRQRPLLKRYTLAAEKADRSKRQA